MNSKKIAPTSVAAPAKAEKYSKYFSTSNFSTPDSTCQILALLSPGKENGVKCAELSAAIGLDSRVLRRQIQAARQSGSVILSSTRFGYYRPGTIEELEIFVRSMRHRCAEITASTRAAERALDAATGQTRIDGW